MRDCHKHRCPFSIKNVAQTCVFGELSKRKIFEIDFLVYVIDFVSTRENAHVHMNLRHHRFSNLCSNKRIDELTNWRFVRETDLAQPALLPAPLTALAFIVRIMSNSAVTDEVQTWLEPSARGFC